MSKILSATCEAGTVTVEGQTVMAEVLSQGTKSSEGVLILEGEEALYLPSSALDIKELIESLNTIIQQIVIITTSLDSVTTSPGTAAAAIAQLTLLKTQLNLTKDNLR